MDGNPRAAALGCFDLDLSAHPAYPLAHADQPIAFTSRLRIEPLAAPVAPCTLEGLEKVTAAAFGQRRKMLRQSLKSLGGEALLEKAGIDPTRRAEELDVIQFAALARAL